MLEWLRRLSESKNPFPISVCWNDEVVLLDFVKKRREQFRWDAVQTIAAYKIDCWAYDEICLKIGADHAGESRDHVISEETARYADLLEELLRRFPDMDAGWWKKVAFPAFEENYTVLWKRPSGRESA